MKYLLFTAALLGALSVALGAFGAHKLKELLSPDRLEVFRTGVLYHMIHVLAIFAAAFVYKIGGSGWALYGAYAFILGIVLFSGSLYLLASRSLLEIESWGPSRHLAGSPLLLDGYYWQ